MLTQERFGTVNPYTLNQGELEQWAAWNTSNIARNLAGVERNLQDALAGRDEDLTAQNPDEDVRPTGEVFYVPRGTESPLATGIIIPAGLGVLDLEFAEKDWSRGEATRVYNPLTDSLAVTVLYDSGTPVVIGGMHNRFRATEDTLLPSEVAIGEDWQESYENVFAAKGLSAAIRNKRAMEIVSVATRKGYLSSGNAIAMMNVTSVMTARDVDFYFACLDESIGGMLNQKDDGFIELGLPRINFHSPRPNANRTTVQACNGPQWRANMLNPESPSYSPVVHNRFWSFNNRVMKKYAVTILS